MRAVTRTGAPGRPMGGSRSSMRAGGARRAAAAIRDRQNFANSSSPDARYRQASSAPETISVPAPIGQDATTGLPSGSVASVRIEGAGRRRSANSLALGPFWAPPRVTPTGDANSTSSNPDEGTSAVNGPDGFLSGSSTT